MHFTQKGEEKTYNSLKRASEETDWSCKLANNIHKNKQTKTKQTAKTDAVTFWAKHLLHFSPIFLVHMKQYNSTSDNRIALQEWSTTPTSDRHAHKQSPSQQTDKHTHTHTQTFQHLEIKMCYNNQQIPHTYKCTHTHAQTQTHTNDGTITLKMKTLIHLPWPSAHRMTSHSHQAHMITHLIHEVSDRHWPLAWLVRKIARNGRSFFLQKYIRYGLVSPPH